MTHDKSADLKKLKDVIGSRKLSFASEVDLAIKLDLIKGSVTPLGILNDEDRSVEVIIDNDITKRWEFIQTQTRRAFGFPLWTW